MENVKTPKALYQYCKMQKVRMIRATGARLKKYIIEHSDALISHGICPECAEELYGNEDGFQQKKE
jgi:hypothetical protein